MDLTGSLIKNTYGNVLTLGTVAGTPTSGTLQNGAGQNVTSLTLSSTATIFGTGGYKLTISGGGQSFLPNLDIIANLGFGPAFTSDTFLTRDGASNTLAQRNSTNAQTFNLYNTYTDASNYERGFLKWNSNVLEIGAEALGTGTQRTVRLVKIPINTLWVESQFANYGLQFNNNGETEVVLNGVVRSRIGSNSSQWNGGQWAWSSTSNATGALDTGLARDSAGVVKVTDGSTGTGELIFIVPTSDPGITGALWNNGGTLAISA